MGAGWVSDRLHSSPVTPRCCITHGPGNFGRIIALPALAIVKLGLEASTGWWALWAVPR
jgi:hypothetical protein